LKPVITVSGLHGSGKSTYGRRIAAEYGLRHVSAGELFRQIAQEKEYDLEQLGIIASQDHSIDRLVDERTKQEAAKGNVVIDGQLTGWMAKDVADLKFFFTAPANIRIERMAKRDGEAYDIKEQETASRERIQRQRYREIYAINIDDLSIYDLIMDTSLFSIDENINILKNIISDYLAESHRK
jgi:cytidylate kinase